LKGADNEHHRYEHQSFPSSEAAWLIKNAVESKNEYFDYYAEFKGILKYHMVEKLTRWIEANGGTYSDGRTTCNYRLHIRMIVVDGVFTDEYVEIRKGIMKSSARVTFVHVRETYTLTETEVQETIIHIEGMCKPEFIVKGE
jgi:hypothetical protein